MVDIVFQVGSGVELKASIVQPEVSFQVGWQNVAFNVAYAAGTVGPDAGLIRLVAGEPIDRNRVVRSEAGQAMLCDGANAAHADTALGIALTTVAQGELLDIRVGDVLEDPAWSWNDGVVFVGPAGALVENEAVATGFLQVIGTVGSPTKITVTPMRALVRE